MQAQPPSSDTVWTVSALNFEVKTLLSKGIGTLWIEGEISNFVCPSSGHWYFTLKDERAQCRAAMFKGRNSRVGFVPENGQHVLLRAQVTLYEARGEYQLLVDHLEDAGIGELMRRYEQLKNRLDKEGLFRDELKQPIPSQPKKIGIITSPTGAAIRDVLSVIRRRAPHIPVLIFPTMVQGEGAAAQLIEALQSARREGGCDVILMVRGGGSLEDLWCFNDEALARVIAAYPIPVVTGIGHEIDFTIADFTADLRTPTPSVAAETVTPDRFEMMQTIDARINRMTSLVLQRLTHDSEGLRQIQKRLKGQHPSRQFEALKMRLKYAYDNLLDRARMHIGADRHRLQLCHSTIQQSSPLRKIRQQQEYLIHLRSNTINAIKQSLLAAGHQFAIQAKSLDTLSPLKTLSRGFATIRKGEQLVSSVNQLSTGDEIEITLSDGSKQARVE
ncbi:MAG: exodeoxyribonuclease VII large subunit [Proteobacteria bacterium]|nr:exodeoxyribonuclease VII large subunit [Pseudomonadota bacterium]